ncbi:hypothetical protein ACS0TY_004130 [Phlomoides rotata]
MEQFRQVGEVVGSLKALMVLKHDISINQRQCCLLFDMMQLAFETISEEIQKYLKLEEKSTKWKALELPMKDLHRVFKDAECYLRYCIDVKDWWGKAISLHMNRDCVDLHAHNLLSCFPVVIEAIETAAEISGADQDEMQKRRTALLQKYDQECDDPKFFLWKFGKQYLVPKEICDRLDSVWKEDRWLLLEKVRENKSSAVGKTEQRLAELLLRKLEGSNGKILPSSILVGAEDYNVRRRLGAGYPTGGGHLKEIHWLGESFALRTFYGDITPLIPDISSLLSLSHPNVMQYLCAFHDEGRKEGFLVMELMHKDLGSYIKEHSGQRNRIPFSIPVAVDIMLQIARGMEYLHSKKIYHGDLNPSNVLLKTRAASPGSFQAKVSGFGVTSIKSYTSRSPKPVAVNLDIWLAPEVLAELEQADGKCSTIQTEKADVYSFGMLCFELLNGKLPFEDGHLQGEKMVRNILAGERPLFSYPSPKYLANLTRKCWQTNPSLRPSFSSICRILRYIKKNLVINPDHGDPDSAPPLVDYCDMEVAYLRKFPSEGSGNLAPVTQIPFQMFTYKTVEKDKISGKKWDLANPPVFDYDQLAAMDDLFLVPSDQRTVCSEIIDRKNSGMAMDVRTVISETAHRKLVPFDQGSLGSASPRRRFSTLPVSGENVDQKPAEYPLTKSKSSENFLGNEILEKRKSLRRINEQKPASSEASEVKTSSLVTQNKTLAEIPETKAVENDVSIQKMVTVSSANHETKTESTGKSGHSDNSDKKPTLMGKLKAIKTKLISGQFSFFLVYSS